MNHTPSARHSLLLTVGLACSTLWPGPARADVLAEVRTAVAESSTDIDLRYRYEYVDQAGIAEEAGASTLRTRLTWSSGAVAGFSAGIEADYVSVIGGERYNSTVNGETEYPVVADPDGLDLNQAFLRYRGDTLTVTGGRQRILHADQRFVGGVGWRQNEQTYDAVRLEAQPAKALHVDYAWVGNVNRIFGPDDGAQPADWRSDSHLLNARFTVSERLQVGAFAYLLDFDNDNGPANSTATYGIQASGSAAALSWSARLARQRDHDANPADYQADYAALSGELTLAALSLHAGYEVLGSDGGNAAFVTPLATLHKFQGWADKFLTTPAAGLRDAFVGVSRRFGPVAASVSYHDFEADDGGAAYGSEVDAALTYTLRQGATVQLKLADYQADDFATDTTKVWLTLQVGL